MNAPYAIGDRTPLYAIKVYAIKDIKEVRYIS
jgi:hypothetical protein